ncbi:MAG: hypothetical protein IJS52_04225 [Bacilli bacterium]|nr:hypothetical protein [Bacilli bacterium]
MEQTELEQFLDTGWMNGAELFFRGRIYRTERCVDKGRTGLTTVFSWHAKKVSEKEYDDEFTDEEKKRWICIYENAESTEENARLALLSAPIFDGKSFWEAVDEIEWLDHA